MRTEQVYHPAGVKFHVVLLFLALCVSLRCFATTTIVDPLNDNKSFPDIRYASGGFTSTHLVLSAGFRPGTLDPSDLGFSFELDSDLNSSTGIQPPQFPVGVDYFIFYDSKNSLSTADVINTVAFQQIGTLPVSFSTDSLTVNVPLSLLGNDDGVTRFTFGAGIPETTHSFVVSDEAPDLVDGNPVFSDPTTPIPEPALYGWLLAGLVVLGRNACTGIRRVRATS